MAVFELAGKEMLASGTLLFLFLFGNDLQLSCRGAQSQGDVRGGRNTGMTLQETQEDLGGPMLFDTLNQATKHLDKVGVTRGAPLQG